MLIPIAANGFWQPRDAPTPSLRETARLFDQIKGQTIIEIGSGIHGRLAGDSVVTWAKRTKAKRIIYLFQNGAPSQLDLFDYKPLLQKMHGEELPDSIRNGQRLTGGPAARARIAAFLE